MSRTFQYRLKLSNGSFEGILPILASITKFVTLFLLLDVVAINAVVHERAHLAGTSRTTVETIVFVVKM